MHAEYCCVLLCNRTELDDVCRIFETELLYLPVNRAHTYIHKYERGGSCVAAVVVRV